MRTKKNELSYEKVIVPRWEKVLVFVSLLAYVAFYFIVDISNLGLPGILILSFLFALFIVSFTRYKTPSAKRRYELLGREYQESLGKRRSHLG